MNVIKLKKDRDKSFYRKHPWIFSGAVDSIQVEPANGATLEIVTFDGKLLGRGAYSAQSQIIIRVWSFDPKEIIDTVFFQKKILSAFNFRKQILDLSFTNAYRIINSECDSLPGLVVDYYSEFLVCQFLSAGAEYWKDQIVKLLWDFIKPKGIYERSDVEVREKDGLSISKGLLFGEEPPPLLEIIENGIKYFVDIRNGHKTGFYLDQRNNRELLSAFSQNAEVLNCFSYTGGFSLSALKNGAKKVTSIDCSADALEILNKNINLNNFNMDRAENINDDVFKVLRKFRDSGKEFDVIILDPPKFAESSNQIHQASRGYKDINLLALKLLKQNGTLFTFSCSGHISPDLFQKIVAGAASDSGRNVRIIKYLTQSMDHPISTAFPEGLYLKGLICKVD